MTYDAAPLWAILLLLVSAPIEGRIDGCLQPFVLALEADQVSAHTSRRYTFAEYSY